MSLAVEQFLASKGAKKIHFENIENWMKTKIIFDIWWKKNYIIIDNIAIGVELSKLKTKESILLQEKKNEYEKEINKLNEKYSKETKKPYEIYQQQREELSNKTLEKQVKKEFKKITWQK